MVRLAAYIELILEAVHEYRRKNAVAGWYTAENLMEWIKKQHPAEWKSLIAAYRDSPKPTQVVRDDIDSYLPSLNQRVLQKYPTNILWRVSATTKPPETAPAIEESPKPSRPRRQRGQPWVAMIEKNDLDGLRCWLDDGGDPNSPARTKEEQPLDYAAVWGNEGTVRLLLERGAKGTQPLFEAASNHRGDIARILLESGVPTLDDMRQSASYLRALGDDDDLIRLIRNAQRRRSK